eukprot:jgi/Psemu1/291715/fgenesh1_pg.787_\
MGKTEEGKTRPRAPSAFQMILTLLVVGILMMRGSRTLPTFTRRGESTYCYSIGAPTDGVDVDDGVDNGVDVDVDVGDGVGSSSIKQPKASKQTVAGSGGSGSSKKIDSTSTKAKVQYPLQPPFHLMQLGTPRTGSTFQTTLLDAIATLKTQQKLQLEDPDGPPFEISLLYHYAPTPKNGKIEPFVMKSHRVDFERFKNMTKRLKVKRGVDVHLFTSTHGTGNLDAAEFAQFSEISLHEQTLSNLYNCSMCEIEKYVPIFGLTPEDLAIIKEYMSKYEIIRQCCGLQQSKYNRYRLHGCNVTQLLADDPTIHYPYCERRDIPAIENEFAALPIKYRSRSEKTWTEPGDCAKFEEKIKNGKDFNGSPFRSCDTFLKQYSPERIAQQQQEMLTKEAKRAGR